MLHKTVKKISLELQKTNKQTTYKQTVKDYKLGTKSKKKFC